MRILLKTTPSQNLVPYNYQPFLVGAFHKWLGQNDIHDELSLYSLSWLEGALAEQGGFSFPKGASFFIASPSGELLYRLIQGIKEDPSINFGLEVDEILIQPAPKFRERERFYLNSPVFIKRKVGEESKFYFPKDEEADLCITETLRNKLKKAGLADLPILAQFDKSYRRIKVKLINYNGIKIKASFCPVLLQGDPRAIEFAWNVGVGNSTGIGFGALQ